MTLTMTALPLGLVQGERAITCVGCGSCCEHIGYPPVYEAFFPPDGETIPRWLVGSEDHERFLSLPDAAREELRAYFVGVRNGAVMPRTSAGADGIWSSACLWFDRERRLCRHYEHRPSTCRDFPPGNPLCLWSRDGLRIVSPSVQDVRREVCGHKMPGADCLM